jgi:hypothetical protein
MYLIPTEAYQHWLMAWLGAQVLVLALMAEGVEKVA